MRNRFDRQLLKLNEQLITMGALCEDVIAGAVKLLSAANSETVETVLAKDSEIDQKEREIESLCMKILLQQQPVARDLRTVSSALKMISDMERIGDQAADIAEISMHIKGDSVPGQVHIHDMAVAVIKMVTDSVDSFVKKDLSLAHSVMKYDDVVDDLFIKVRRELIQMINADEQNGERCLDLLMIAKYLERIGDHATNVAEWVVYSITGAHDTEVE